MNEHHLQRLLFRIWVRLHPQKLRLAQLRPLRREVRRFVRQVPAGHLSA